MKNKLLVVLALGLGLTACDREQSELQSWMDQERKSVNPTVAKVERPKEFEPYRYESGGQLDPFSASKLNKALEAAASRPSKSGLQPDLARRRESLETHPLDAIKMVGHIRRSGKDVALLSVDALVFTVKVGNYLGQNFGKITKISEAEIVVKELVQDATGDWVEREASLQLQEASKKSL
jgi:type IV pilus assembly protein PilP